MDGPILYYFHHSLSGFHLQNQQQSENEDHSRIRATDNTYVCATSFPFIL